MGIPAVVAAGDRRAAKRINGESKPYLLMDGRPLVAHVVSLLQDVPEVSEVWVIGDAARLEAALLGDAVGNELRKPLHVIDQFRNIIENAWESYRRLLPGAPAEGRDPESAADRDQAVLYLSADIPFATPEEVSAFIQKATESGAEYALGLCTEESMLGFRPQRPGEQGIEVANFNLREGRYRQSNLHWVLPARLRKRQYIEDMYEQRHQRRLGPVLRLAWQLFWADGGGAAVLYYFALMHAASWTDRRGLRRFSDWLRRRIPRARIEKGCGKLIGADFRLVVTEVGGCAVDIDTAQEYEAARARFAEWKQAQAERAAQLRHVLPRDLGDSST